MKLVIQNNSHVWGGNEKWLATLGEGLIGRGHDVVVSCASGPVQFELASRGIPTSPFRPRGAIDFVSGLTFAAWLRGQRPDAVLLTSWRPTTWTMIAGRGATRARMVMRLGIVRRFPAPGPRALALRKLDAMIVNSDEIRDVWRESAPWFPAGRIHVVLNGVRSRIAERAALRETLRRELGLSEHSLIVGGAGHVAPRKGFDILLQAFARANVTDSVLAIAGDGPHRAELENLARELGITERVRWLGHRTDGAGAIGGFDLFVLSSRNEGMANVMLEAMAGGSPVIASDVSGVRTAIAATGERPEAGLIVRATDAEALAAEIRNVCNRLRSAPDSIDELTREALWRVENWFSAERMVDACEQILFNA